MCEQWQRPRAHGEHEREQWTRGHGTMRSWDERCSEASGDGRLGRLERGRMEQRTAPAIGRGWGLVLVPCWWSWEAKAFPHDDVTQDKYIYTTPPPLFFYNGATQDKYVYTTPPSLFFYNDATQDKYIYTTPPPLFFLTMTSPRAKKRGGGEYTEVCKLVSSLQKKEEELDHVSKNP